MGHRSWRKTGVRFRKIWKPGERILSLNDLINIVKGLYPKECWLREKNKTFLPTSFGGNFSKSFVNSLWWKRPAEEERRKITVEGGFRRKRDAVFLSSSQYNRICSGVIKHTMKTIKQVRSKVATTGWLKCQGFPTGCVLSAITHKEEFNSYCANYPTMCTINFYGLLWNVTWPFLSSNIASSDSDGKHILRWQSVKEMQSPGTKWNGWCPPRAEEQLWRLCSFPDMSKQNSHLKLETYTLGLWSFPHLIHIKATTDHVWGELTSWTSLMISAGDSCCNCTSQGQPIESAESSVTFNMLFKMYWDIFVFFLIIEISQQFCILIHRAFMES